MFSVPLVGQKLNLASLKQENLNWSKIWEEEDKIWDQGEIKLLIKKIKKK